MYQEQSGVGQGQKEEHSNDTVERLQAKLNRMNL
jgi:hypothetical protein